MNPSNISKELRPTDAIHAHVWGLTERYCACKWCAPLHTTQDTCRKILCLQVVRPAAHHSRHLQKDTVPASGAPRCTPLKTLSQGLRYLPSAVRFHDTRIYLIQFTPFRQLWPLLHCYARHSTSCLLSTRTPTAGSCDRASLT